MHFRKYRHQICIAWSALAHYCLVLWIKWSTKWWLLYLPTHSKKEKSHLFIQWNITRTTRGDVKQNLHPPLFHRMHECTRNTLRQPKRSSAKPLKSAHPSPWCSADNINTLFTGKGITRPQYSRKRDIKDRHTPADGAHTHTHLLITPSLNTPQSDCKGHQQYFKVPCQPKTHLHTSGWARSQLDWHLFCKGTARETGSARVR